MWSKRCIVWLRIRKTDASQKFYRTEFVYFIYKVIENWLYDFVSWWRNSDTIIHGTCTASVYKCIYLFVQEKVVLWLFFFFYRRIISQSSIPQNTEKNQ